LACPQARFAPVYVGDVVERIVSSLDDPETWGRRLELCGPEIFTLREIVEYTAQTLGLRRKIIGLPNFLSQFQAVLMEYFVPGKPFSVDNYYSLQLDSVCRCAPPLPTSLTAIAPGYLANRNSRSLYNRFRRRHRS